VLVRLVAVGLAAAAVTSAVAFFVPWLPTPASKQADRIDFVFWFVTGISIAIFALVAAVILYSVVRFRARPDDDSDGAPIHGNTTLEIAWTAVPAVLVTAVAVVSAVALAQNEHLPKNHLQVNVSAEQFAWTFSYPKYQGLTVSQLRLPIGETVQLKMHSKDVIHSFWVPEFGQKQDLVPGIETKLVITPKRLGTYPIACTELCGEGHALMRSEAVVMKPAAFTAWVKAQEKAAASAAQGSAGEAPDWPPSTATAARPATPTSPPARPQRQGPTSITSPPTRGGPGSRSSHSSVSRSSIRTPTSRRATSRTSCRTRSSRCPSSSSTRSSSS
jgi:cytochrome c oxidase subunit 2